MNNRILPEESDILTEIGDHQFPQDVESVITVYEDTVGERDRFLWKWAHNLFPRFTLSCVPSQDVTSLQDTKLLMLMFVSILDDLAEKNTDLATFHEARKIPFEYQEPDLKREHVNTDILRFAEDVWDKVQATVATSPSQQKFSEILVFDFAQVINAIQYSYLLNTVPEIVNLSELYTYDSHNMMVFVFADIDLLFSPSFDPGELAKLRQVLTHAQRMTRIGNWITTWERELSEGDISSGIVVYCIEQGIIDQTQVKRIITDSDQHMTDAIVALIHEQDIETVFLDQWKDELSMARELNTDLDSVDIEAYLDGIEMVMEYHFASRGLK